MNKDDYKLVEKAFNNYYENYKDNSNNIILKYNHSFNVAKLMEELADRLYLSDEEKYLAKTIGLLHDIGRFEQLKEFDSFSDKLLDHADYGCKYLFKENHIRDFIKDDKYDHIINKAIFNHSKLKIEDNLDEDELFFSKMIRDMDKVDIYYQSGVWFNQEFIDKPTKKVVDLFFKGVGIPNKDRKNKSDGVILCMSYLNDINFKETYEILKETDNLGFYLSCVDVSKENEETFNKLRDRCISIMDEEIINE